MVEEKKVYRVLYEAELEIYGVDEDGYNYWIDNEPSDEDFLEAIKYDMRKALSREDGRLTQLNYWTAGEKVKKLLVERIR